MLLTRRFRFTHLLETPTGLSVEGVRSRGQSSDLTSEDDGSGNDAGHPRSRTIFVFPDAQE